MALRLPNWRKEELSIDEVIAKHPDVPKFVIIKTDLNRRGYKLTEAAQARLDPKIHQVGSRGIFGESGLDTPVGLLLRDGTSVVGGHWEQANRDIRDPWIIDVVDGKLVATDQGKVYEEVEFWARPDYFDYTTSKGNPGWAVLGARPSRLDFTLNRHCHFWDKPGGGCKYCTIGAVSVDNKKKNIDARADLDELVETVAEALKQKGRYTDFCVTSGSILSGKELLEDEVDLYIEAFKKLRTLFKTDFLRIQLVGTAYNKRQLERLRDEGGLRAYTTDLEVLDKDIFGWVCEGKAEFIGYEGWKQRLYDAVEVFGKGNVNAGIVGGVDLAKPHGHKTEEESLAKSLAEVEELARHGVSTINSTWNIGENTVFKNQVPPSLDYYVSLAKGIEAIRSKHGITIYHDDYRRCGNHPSSDLARI
jgi:hypothetical protein